MTAADPPIAAAGTIAIGDLTVHRLGYGAMRLTGPGVWGAPDDPVLCVNVLRRALDLGVDFIDTADSYGPEVSEDLIRRALHPYPDQLVLATKAGCVRSGPDEWSDVGRPEYLRQQCEMSLRRLRLECIDLYQLHRVDAKVPEEEQFGLMRDLQEEGKIRHVGLSEVTVEQIERAREIVPIVSVQNHYNLLNRKSHDVLGYCEREAIAFIPWFPVAAGKLARPLSKLASVIQGTEATPAQIALAWLLHSSPVSVPIPGTSSIAHLEENCAAAGLQLNPTLVAELTAAVDN